MVPATAAVYDAVVQSRLRHDGDPRLTRHIANATPHYSRHGVMLRKGRESNKKIDLAVAAIMAWSRAMTISTPPAVQPAPPVSLISL
jgi:phage terminase large subunit-like protein